MRGAGWGKLGGGGGGSSAMLHTSVAFEIFISKRGCQFLHFERNSLKTGRHFHKLDSLGPQKINFAINHQIGKTWSLSLAPTPFPRSISALVQMNLITRYETKAYSGKKSNSADGQTN